MKFTTLFNYTRLSRLGTKLITWTKKKNALPYTLLYVLSLHFKGSHFRAFYLQNYPCAYWFLYNNKRTLYLVKSFE